MDLCLKLSAHCGSERTCTHRFTPKWLNKFWCFHLKRVFERATVWQSFLRLELEYSLSRRVYHIHIYAIIGIVDFFDQNCWEKLAAFNYFNGTYVKISIVINLSSKFSKIIANTLYFLELALQMSSAKNLSALGNRHRRKANLCGMIFSFSFSARLFEARLTKSSRRIISCSFRS